MASGTSANADSKTEPVFTGLLSPPFKSISEYKYVSKEAQQPYFYSLPDDRTLQYLRAEFGRKMSETANLPTAAPTSRDTPADRLMLYKEQFTPYVVFGLLVTIGLAVALGLYIAYQIFNLSGEGQASEQY